jgi:hypothetical protein
MEEYDMSGNMPANPSSSQPTPAVKPVVACPCAMSSPYLEISATLRGCFVFIA